MAFVRVYSADYILLLVLLDHGIYSENSKMTILLDSFSKQFLNILGIFRLISVFQMTAMLKFANSLYYPPAPFTRFIWSLMRRNRGMAQLLSYECFFLLLKDLNFLLLF